MELSKDDTTVLLAALGHLGVMLSLRIIESTYAIVNEDSVMKMMERIILTQDVDDSVRQAWEDGKKTDDILKARSLQSFVPPTKLVH